MVGILVLALCAFSFAATASVNPITQTETSYTLEKDAYDTTNLSTGVRFSFTAPSTGSYSIKVSESSGGDFNFWSCTDNNFNSCSSLDNFWGSSDSYTTSLILAKGQVVYYKVTLYNNNSSYKAYAFEISYNTNTETSNIYVINVTSGSTNCIPNTNIYATRENYYSTFSATALPGFRPNGWKIKSGTATIKDSTANQIQISTSTDVTLELQCEAGTIYQLDSTYKGFTFYKHSSYTGDNIFGIRTSFKASNDGLYAIVTKTKNSYTRYTYSTQDFTSYTNSTTCSSNGFCKYVFNALQNSSYYFLLNQSYNSYMTDSIYAKVLPTIKVNADTSGNGYAYVGVNLRNYDSSYVAGDTVPLSASSSYAKFDHWEIVSGNCSILDSTLYTTSVVIQGDCRVKAVFVPPTMNAITTDEKSYTTGKDFSLGSSYTNGIRFYFTAPTSGAYIINFRSKNKSSMDLYYYSNDGFYNYTKSKTAQTMADTLYMSKGDSVFYAIQNSYPNDTIIVNYKTTKAYTVTVTSSSEHCVADTSSIATYAGALVTVNAKSETGYRTNGWKFLSGKRTVKDSTTTRIRFLISSDIKLQLNCSTPKLIEIDSVLRRYTISNDFYEKDSSSGARFRFIPQKNVPYIITLDVTSHDGYFSDYGSDSTFSSYKTRNNYYNTIKYIDYIPTAAGESNYFKMEPFSNGHYTTSFGIRASRRATILIDSTNVKNIPLGDSTSINATIPTHMHFTHWALLSGKGYFGDSSAISTYYKPISDSSKIAATFTKLPIYKLTDQWKTYKLTENGTQSNTMGVSIQTSYKASDSGSYVLQIENPDKGVYYALSYPDSTFDSTYIYYAYDDVLSSRWVYTADAPDTTFYLQFSTTSSYPFDSLQLRMLPVSNIVIDTTSNGNVYLDTYRYNLDRTIPGDTLKLIASAYANYRFNKWQVTSGKCKIADSSKVITDLYVTGDCHVKAIFKEGTIYKISSTPQQYNTLEHYYSQTPNDGVRFVFVAPTDGDFYLVVSRDQKKNLSYERYSSKAYSSRDRYVSLFNPTYTEKLTMSKGDSALLIIKNYNYADSTVPFWISYGTTTSELTITADSNGSVSPTNYSPIVNGAKYGITANGYTDYRFNKWNIVSGTPVIDDVYAPRTLVSVKNDAEVMATFRKGQVYSLTKKFKTYNFQSQYYSDNYYDIRFTWTPTDTNTYVIQFKPVDSLAAIFNDYQTDSTFYSKKNIGQISGATSFLVKGNANEPLFWSIQDSTYEPQNKSFKVKIGNPYVLNITPVAQGVTSPSGSISVLPYADTIITARPYGGYVFNKWVVDSGKVTIEDPTMSKTKFTVTDSFCVVRPTYTIDLTVQPELTITGTDLTNHPGVCAQVNVVDKNNGRTIAGMDSSYFILYQDNQALPIQVTSLQDVSGVSVALVIDESGSMSGSPIRQAKEAVIQFIDEMGPYDRTAIIGFDGGIDIIQEMTSDKDLLYAGAERIYASGGTNINDGAYRGLEELAKETNATTVIIFSDGDGSGSKSNQAVIDLANGQGTTIYSIAIGGNRQDPLKYIAEGTGGTFTVAPSADQLSSIYSNIQTSVQARYVICYESPDQTLDDDKHEIIIKTNFNGKNAADTTTWREDFMPPKITLTKATQDMIGVSQDPGDTIVIGAYIKTTSSISSAKIYLRQTANPSKPFQALEMEQINDSLWTYTIPDADVEGPGIDFYIIAEESTGLLGKTPAIPTPSREPYTIPIDNDVPVVKLVNKDCIDTTSGYGQVSFTINDSNGISNAYIYYKDSLDILYLEKSMTYNSKNKNWVAKIPAEHFTNGSAEYYVRALDSTGTAVRWPKTRSKYLTPCYEEPPDTLPPVKDSISIVNAEVPNAKISRATKEVGLVVKSNSFTTDVDTITASLKCLRSGDQESNIKLVEKKDGWYENLKTIYKDEYSAKKNNNVISCEGTDTLIATYKNPKTGNMAYDTVAIGDFVNITYQFLKVKEDEDLDSVKTSLKAKFRLRVTTTSPKASAIDTINVKLFTNKKDTLVVKAVETDVNSAMFDYTGAFYFEEDSLSMKDSLLDAVLDFTKSKNRVRIQAQFDKDSSKLSDRDSLIVYTTYVPADSAEMYDKDLDGEADFVRVHFMKPLKGNIESIDSIFWPKSGHDAPKGKIKASSIKIEKKDSSWIEAKLEKPFAYGKTVPDTAKKPYLKLTKTSSDISQKVYLSDKVGAVPNSAKKLPGKVYLDDYLNPNMEIPPDTIKIVMSEKIKRTGKKDAWKDLFRYSKSCKDTASQPLKILGEPQMDSAGLEWKIVLADYAIMVGNCIKSNPDADYVDLSNNSLGRGGVEIEGEDGSLYLYDISPNPAVSGIGGKSKWLPPEGKDFETVPDTLSTIKILTISAYTADIYIYDNQGHYVNHLTEKITSEELKNSLRGNSSKREKLAYLYWDQRTENDRKVGTGIYIWKIFFKFNDGHAEIRTLRTGIKRNSENKD